MEMALGLAYRARLGRDAEVGVPAGSPNDVLGRAAADVDDDEGPVVAWALRGGAEEREPGLLVAGDDAGVEAVAIVEQLPELVAVRGVARCGGRERDRALGPELVDNRLVLVEHLRHTVDRRVRETAGRIDALAEPGYGGASVELGNASIVDIRDKDAGGVGSKVDDGDSHGPVGLQQGRNEAPRPGRCRSDRERRAARRRGAARAFGVAVGG